MKFSEFVLCTLCVAVIGFLVTGYSCSPDSSESNSSSDLITDSFNSDELKIPTFNSGLTFVRRDVEGNNDWTMLFTNIADYSFKVMDIDNDYSDDSLTEVNWIMHNSINDLMKHSINEFGKTPSFEDIYLLETVDHQDNSYLEAWQSALQSGDCYSTGNDVIKFTLTVDLYHEGKLVLINDNSAYQNVSIGFQLFKALPFEEF